MNMRAESMQKRIDQLENDVVEANTCACVKDPGCNICYSAGSHHLIAIIATTRRINYESRWDSIAAGRRN